MPQDHSFDVVSEFDRQELVNAVEIKANQVGVKTLRWGKEPQRNRESSYAVPEGFRGVQAQFGEQCDGTANCAGCRNTGAM